MSVNKNLKLPNEFKVFLQQIDDDYRCQLATIPLFDKKITSAWNEQQRFYFAAVFYHLRGHFIDFMWYLANFTQDSQIREAVLDNIREEIGSADKMSHEKLYEYFAHHCGVNIHDEIVNETHYLPFARQFNKAHLEWLSRHDIGEQVAAFAAYERLDNIDYPFLTTFAESLNLPEKTITFFRVHIYVEHFNSLLEKLLPTWHESPEKVKNAFNFIYSHQLTMWRELSEIISLKK